ncbi:MAG: DinB family protein [Acidimicrobiales bacterium]
MATIRELPDAVEPKRIGDELTNLTEFLDFYRAVLVRKAWGLSAEQLATRLGPSSLTIGGLLKHMALVEDTWFEHRFAGRQEPEPWASAPWDSDQDWELNTACDDSLDHLLELFATACERSRVVVSGAESLDTTVAITNEQGDPINLRWILVHMIEEYARHVGHADLLREAIDGQTGD